MPDISVATRRVTYIGPLDAVEIAATGQIVKRGQTVDVPVDIADGTDEAPHPHIDGDVVPATSGLLAQSEWQAADKSTKSSKEES